jgi:hypothetical protein
MQKISVSPASVNSKINPKQYRVEVSSDDGSTTAHQVSLSDEYYQTLTGGLKSPEDFIRSAFEFLLERESKESILERFDLTEIKKYFPEFEAVISAS